MVKENLLGKKQSEQFLAFLLNGKYYGFPILKLNGVINIPQINPIPKAPDFVKGSINFRGKILPIIDMRLFFGMPEIEYNEQTCIILTKIGINNSERLVGFIVDTVSEVFNILLSEIGNLPIYDTDLENKFLRGIGKMKGKVVMLLNTDKIIEIKDIVDFFQKDLKEINI